MAISRDALLSNPTPRKRVLVVRPSRALQDALDASTENYRVVCVASVEEAARDLRMSAPDLVIAEAASARRMLKELEASTPSASRIFLCDMTNLENVRILLELAAEGHLFSTLDDSLPSKEITRRLTQNLLARVSARVPPLEKLEAAFEINGEKRSFVVSDVSNTGVALEIDASSDVNHLTPGADLVHFRLKQANNVIFRAQRAYLKHLRFEDHATKPFFRAGVAFADQKELEVAPAINDPMRIMGLVRRAVARSSPVYISNWADRSRSFELRDAKLSPVGGHLILHGVAEGCVVSAGDILQIQFEVNGLSYAGLASLASFMQVKPPRLALFVPPSVTLRHRRQHARFKVNARRPFAVSLVSPITGERLVRPVLDLQTTGLSFTFDAAVEALPVGLDLREVELSLPDGTAARCAAMVRDFGHIPDDLGTTGFKTPRRCGLSLRDVPHHVKEVVLEAFLTERSPSMRTAQISDFDNIWNVIRDAGGSYPDYPLKDGPHLKTLETAFRKLQGSGQGIGKVLLYDDEGGKPIGHASGLRYYSSTWVLQHLAVKPGFVRDRFVGRDLSSLVVEHGELLDDVEWVRKIWNVKNRWVNRTGGWIAKTLLNQSLCYSRSFNFMHIAMPNAAGGDPAAVRVGEREDRLHLEKFLVRDGQALRMKTDDLSADEFNLQKMRTRLQSFGLHRHREMLVSTANPNLIALVEEATEGMHWGEFLNGFSLINTGTGVPAEKDILNLVDACVEHYRRRARPSAVALVDDEYVEVLKRTGFAHLGKFSEFTFHRSAVQNFIQLSSAVFERLQRMMERSSIHDVEEQQYGPGLNSISGVSPVPVSG